MDSPRYFLDKCISPAFVVLWWIQSWLSHVKLIFAAGYIDLQVLHLWDADLYSISFTLCQLVRSVQVCFSCVNSHHSHAFVLSASRRLSFCERACLLPVLVESSPGWSCKADFLLNCWLNFSGLGSFGWLSWKLKKYQVKNILLCLCECFPAPLTAVVGFEKLQWSKVESGASTVIHGSWFCLFECKCWLNSFCCLS